MEYDSVKLNVEQIGLKSVEFADFAVTPQSFMDSCLYDLKEYECGVRMRELHDNCLLYANFQLEGALRIANFSGGGSAVSSKVDALGSMLSTAKLTSESLTLARLTDTPRSSWGILSRRSSTLSGVWEGVT
ncbi:hypothetical protein EVAR_78713_1 [Eumeta japonica]|uniref:Uncharacterized protein n=1 Tax=Eumeta variegata TaxID=151549 RepID=A0A4C1T178_EUMVA|nr:hypothetical protein EVAR_78713_1 [Eumeta japonica]